MSKECRLRIIRILVLCNGSPRRHSAIFRRIYFQSLCSWVHTFVCIRLTCLSVFTNPIFHNVANLGNGKKLVWVINSENQQNRQNSDLENSKKLRKLFFHAWNHKNASAMQAREKMMESLRITPQHKLLVCFVRG